MARAQTQDDSLPATEFFGDEALEDPADDVLGYAPFATKLADALLKLKPKSGLVLALYGSWGGGKSTMLNFVARDLASRPKAHQPTIIRFNPWWFSGQEDLVSVFFEELIRGLALDSLTDKSLKAALKGVPPLLRILGKMVSNVPKPILATIGHGAAIAPAIGAGVEQLGKELEKLGVRTLTETKTKIDEKLKRAPSKILIIIDDLDRLAADQIRQMFRLIKAVANFSKIIYITSFDKEVVAKALDPEQVSGENYLAKIVQIAFELPLPDRNAIRKLLETRLRGVLQSQLLEGSDWWQAYGEAPSGGRRNGISHFIKTPRNVVQLTNYLSLSYPSVRTEVNAIDFVTIEALRAFCPSVYDLVRKNQDLFCFARNEPFDLSPAPDPEPRHRRPPGVSLPPPDSKLKDFHELAIKRLVEKRLIEGDDVEPIQRLLVQMFPILTDVFSFSENTFNPAVEDPPQPRRRGICYRDRFPFYFRLSPPEGGVSQTEITRVIENIDAFRTQLEEFARPRPVQPGVWDQSLDKSELVLTELSQNLGRVTEQHAERMLVTAFEFLGNVDRRWVLESLLSKLLSRIPEDSRSSTLARCIERTTHLELSVELVRQLEGVHATSGMVRPPPLFRDSNDRPLVSERHVKELQNFVARKIEKAAQQPEFLDSPRLRFILACWNAWGDRERLKEWGKARVEDPASLAALLAGFMEERYFPGSGRGPPGSSPTGVPDRCFLDSKWLSMFIEPSKLIALARKLDVAGKQKMAVDALLSAYDKQAADEERDPFGTWRIAGDGGA